MIAWHPLGHQVVTAAHDGITKFWCREPPGRLLHDPEYGDDKYNDPLEIIYGPASIPSIGSEAANSVPQPNSSSGNLVGQNPSQYSANRYQQGKFGSYKPPTTSYRPPPPPGGFDPSYDNMNQYKNDFVRNTKSRFS